MSFDLFENLTPEDLVEPIADGAVILRGFARPSEVALLAHIDVVTAIAPWRHLITPGGYTMSVAMSNCGEHGWVSDLKGYRYEKIDPLTGQPWPPIPDWLYHFAQTAANLAGFSDYDCDACLINRYEIGSKLSLHQDRDERDLHQPIVSVSLGVPAMFLFGGLKRGDKTRKYRLQHGDVVVWGGALRLAYHGVEAIKPASHQMTGPRRLNLTFRKV